MADWHPADHCLRCGATENLTRDHVIPRVRGGQVLGRSNLQTLCATCNVWKGSRVLDYRHLPKARSLIHRDRMAGEAGRTAWRAFLVEQRRPRLIYTTETPPDEV